MIQISLSEKVLRENQRSYGLSGLMILNKRVRWLEVRDPYLVNLDILAKWMWRLILGAFY